MQSANAQNLVDHGVHGWQMTNDESNCECSLRSVAYVLRYLWYNTV